MPQGFEFGLVIQHFYKLFEKRQRRCAYYIFKYYRVRQESQEIGFQSLNSQRSPTGCNDKPGCMS